KLAGISLATAPNRACYIPVGHSGADLYSDAPNQLPMTLVLAKLKPLLEDQAVLKIGHNLKFDWVVLEKRGIRVAPYDDTLVMSFNLDAGGLNSHSLDDLAKKHLDHECIAFKDLCGTGQKQITFNLVQLDRATEYAAEDADVALRLWMRFRARMPFERASRVYEMVDRPMVAVVGAMELGGVKVDREVLKSLSAEFNVQIAALEERICGEAGCKFTIGSPQQLGDILFNKMGLSGGRKGKSGTWSTDVTELERLSREGVPIAQLVLDWRQLTKLKSTYTDALQEQINRDTGRVHTSYSLSGAQTGRLASTDPNLMNIPIRTEIGRRIRDAFIAEPGHVMMSADYSQIELRLAAHICDVPQLRAAFERGEDIHNMTAVELFGEANRDTRASAKTINFAILYGISRWGLAGRLGLTADEAQAMIDRYFERFPGISRYIADTLSEVRETGFSTTLFGRKTHFPRIKSHVQHERQGAERAAINAPIQGTAADIIKRAMARMGPALADAGLSGTRMLMQVHDELVFEVPEDEAGRAEAVIRTVMEGAAEPAITLSVPLGVEIGTGPNWGAAH
ncbi:MAG TPA: DNA polymerase, partial [Allosphingosinicella sp.]|nr:DNA polymerase [Allosphingosinicella sp.]